MRFDPFPPRGAALADAGLRVLLALVAEHEQHGRATVRSVGKRAGLTSTQSVVRHLDRLRRAGYITWDVGKQGTLRPLLRRVPLPR